MLKKVIFSFFLVMFSLLSCASYVSFQRAETAYTRGDYSQAVLELTVSLRRDPNQPKAVALLQEAFPRAVTANLDCARSNQEGSRPLKWSGTADCLLLLHRINDEVKALPPLYEKKSMVTVSFQLTYYHQELEVACTRAAEEQYLAGLERASDSSSEAQKQAHRFFQKALEYVPGYKDASQRASSSRDAATARISVLPTSDLTWTYSPVDTALIFNNTLLTNLSQGASKKTYTKIIDRGNLDLVLLEQKLAVTDLIDQRTALKVGGLMGANRIIVTQILRKDYALPEITVSTEKRSVEVPLKGGTKDQTMFATGTFIRFVKKTELTLNVAYKLINLETSELITGDLVEKAISDEAVWGDFQGDEEALSEQDRKIIANGEQEVLTLTELLSAGARQLGQEIATRLLKHLD